MDTFPGQSQPQTSPVSQTNPQSSGASPQPPTSPEPKMDVRTMLSDLASIQESGGGAPKPYAPGNAPAPTVQPSSTAAPSSAPTINTVPQPPSSPFGQNSQLSNTLSGSSTQLNQATPQRAQTPPPPPKTPIQKQAPKKGIFFIVLSLILILGIGAVFYLFILPKFQTSGESAETQNSSPEATTTAGQSEETTTTEALSEAEESTSTEPIETVATTTSTSSPAMNVATTTATTSATIATTTTSTASAITSTTPEATPTSTLPTPVTEEAVSSSKLTSHSSYLKTPADLSSETIIEKLNIENAHKISSFTTAEVASIKEHVLKFSDNSFVDSSQIGKTLSPILFTSALTSLLEEDFTLLVYTDSKGAWPVYVFKAKANSASGAKDKFKQIESVPVTELANFFLSNPGKESVWKTGKVGSSDARYRAFSQNSASLNYSWVGENLILSTNYAAAQETAKRF